MTETSIDLSEIQQIVSDIEANFDLQAAEQNLQSTGTDLSQLQSIGAYGNLTFSPPAGYASGSLTVVVLFDRSDTSQKTVYVTLEGAVGPIVSVPGVPINGGVIGYQGSYDDYSGFFVGVEGTAGVSTQASYAPFSGDWAILVGASTSVSAQANASYTWTLDDLLNLAENGLFDTAGVDPQNLVPVGTGSARLPGQMGSIPAGYELNALDAIAELNAIYGSDEIAALRQQLSDEFKSRIAENPDLVKDPVFIAKLFSALGKDLAIAALDESSCFGPEASISMWPLDPEFAPDPNNPFKQYDQDAVRAKIWKKPIELIRVGDYVVSHDKDGNMVPGYVPRTMTNSSKILLNFHGTPVTPGHVYYRPDSKNSYKYETLIDVLRDDGMIEHSDRVKLRAATNVPVGTPRDGFVMAITGTRRPDGGVDIKEQGRIRLGTRFLVGEGKERKSWAVADLIKAGGGVVGDDELIRVGDGPGMPFHWDFGDTLPKPEDFVLACSQTTLEEIYNAAEWESQGPRLPAPMRLDRGPVEPLKGAALSAMPRNEPLDVSFDGMPTAKPQRTLNRKQRKAMEAKQRKEAKSRKPVVN